MLSYLFYLGFSMSIEMPPTGFLWAVYSWRRSKAKQNIFPISIFNFLMQWKNFNFDSTLFWFSLLRELILILLSSTIIERGDRERIYSNAIYLLSDNFEVLNSYRSVHVHIHHLSSRKTFHIKEERSLWTKLEFVFRKFPWESSSISWSWA